MAKLSGKCGKWFAGNALRLWGVVLTFMLLYACSESYTPKPRGYFRIDLPDRVYQQLDDRYPFTFEYPRYAVILPDTNPLAEPYWINLYFRQFSATLHLSYKPVKGNLADYLNDSHALVTKHIPKANAITQREFSDAENHIYGLEFVIRGAEAASPYQFYLTDSVHNFLRGALYFQLVPNNDSLEPVISFLKEDIQHLINTVRWKSPGKSVSLQQKKGRQDPVAH